jgi:hypothetical protein
MKQVEKGFKNGLKYFLKVLLAVKIKTNNFNI